MRVHSDRFDEFRDRLGEPLPAVTIGTDYEVTPEPPPAKPVYTFFYDPGHGWLCVPLADVEAAGVRSQVSPYSFIDSEGNVFLEEDCDLGLFLTAIGGRDACTINDQCIANGDWIRRLPRLNPA